VDVRVERREVSERVGPRCADDVVEGTCPLDMAQELLAEAQAAARALDQPGDVGDDELPIVEPRDAEVRDERGERVVGDLRSRARERREERRLPRVRQTGEAHVRQELELEPDLAALAFATVL